MPTGDQQVKAKLREFGEPVRLSDVEARVLFNLLLTSFSKF